MHVFSQNKNAQNVLKQQNMYNLQRYICKFFFDVLPIDKVFSTVKFYLHVGVYIKKNAFLADVALSGHNRVLFGFFTCFFFYPTREEIVGGKPLKY